MVNLRNVDSFPTLTEFLAKDIDPSFIAQAGDSQVEGC